MAHPLNQTSISHTHIKMSSPFTEEEFAKIVNAMAENAIHSTQSPENDALLHQYLDPLKKTPKSTHPFCAWVIPPPSPPKAKKARKRAPPKTKKSVKKSPPTPSPPKAKKFAKRAISDDETEQPVQKKKKK